MLGCGLKAVGHRLSCPTARGILVSRPGIEPVSPALAGRFLTTGPPGKSLNRDLTEFMEKEMAAHSSVLAWRIPGMGEPGGLSSLGSHRVRHDTTEAT